MRASVRRRASCGGRERPNKLAIWGPLRFTDYDSEISLGLSLVDASQRDRHARRRSENGEPKTEVSGLRPAAAELRRAREGGGQMAGDGH